MSSEDLIKGELEFLCKVVRGTTHDLVNILSIINEITGLLQDKFRSKIPVDNAEDQKILNSLSKILNQIERGLTIIQSLNHFTHEIETPATSIDLSQSINEFIQLIQYNCRSNGIQIFFTPTKDIIEVKTNKSYLFLYWFKVINSLFENLRKGSEIKISTAQDSITTINIIFEEGNLTNREAIDNLKDFLHWYLNQHFELSIETFKKNKIIFFKIGIRIL